MTAVRILGPGDEPALETFLLGHADTSLFLRSNLRNGGLVDRGAALQATYAAAFESGAVTAVAAHGWNSVVLLQAPVGAAAVARAAVAATGRGVSGIIGAPAQVAAAREALGLTAAVATMDSPEVLFALDLAALAIPPALADGRLACRQPTAGDVEQLVAWRVAYRIEALGSEDGPALAQQCRADVERSMRSGSAWVATDGGRVVAYAVYNAEVPDTVQIGGVYTPPALRSRGYARCVVAGALRAARDRGVTRAVLFTGVDNVAAQKPYRALGFAAIGEYGLVMFARHEPVAPAPR